MCSCVQCVLQCIADLQQCVADLHRCQRPHVCVCLCAFTHTCKCMQISLNPKLHQRDGMGGGDLSTSRDAKRVKEYANVYARITHTHRDTHKTTHTRTKRHLHTQRRCFFCLLCKNTMDLYKFPCLILSFHARDRTRQLGNSIPACWALLMCYHADSACLLYLHYHFLRLLFHVQRLANQGHRCWLPAMLKSAGCHNRAAYACCWSCRWC